MQSNYYREFIKEDSDSDELKGNTDDKVLFWVEHPMSVVRR